MFWDGFRLLAPRDEVSAVVAAAVAALLRARESIGLAAGVRVL